MAAPALVLKAAASILANEKSRKAVGWVLIAVLSPIILLLAFFCTTFSGGAEHNRTVDVYKRQLYMFSIPRGYTDGFTQWCKQVIGLCLSAFLQATILVAGLMVFSDKALLGLGLMLAAGEVPRIAGAFGLDTTTRANIMSAVYTAQAAVNTTRTIVQAVK